MSRETRESLSGFEEKSERKLQTIKRDVDLARKKKTDPKTFDMLLFVFMYIGFCVYVWKTLEEIMFNQTWNIAKQYFVWQIIWHGMEIGKHTYKTVKYIYIYLFFFTKQHFIDKT